MYRNEHLDDEEWTNAINWGDGQVVVPEFHLDDPTLLVLEEEADLIKSKKHFNYLILFRL